MKANLRLPIGILGLKASGVLLIAGCVMAKRDVGLVTVEADLTGLALGHATGVEQAGPHENPL